MRELSWVFFCYWFCAETTIGGYRSRRLLKVSCSEGHLASGCKEFPIVKDVKSPDFLLMWSLLWETPWSYDTRPVFFSSQNTCVTCSLSYAKVFFASRSDMYMYRWSLANPDIYCFQHVDGREYITERVGVRWYVQSTPLIHTLIIRVQRFLAVIHRKGIYAKCTCACTCLIMYAIHLPGSPAYAGLCADQRWSTVLVSHCLFLVEDNYLTQISSVKGQSYMHWCNAENEEQAITNHEASKWSKGMDIVQAATVTASMASAKFRPRKCCQHARGSCLSWLNEANSVPSLAMMLHGLVRWCPSMGAIGLRVNSETVEYRQVSEKIGFGEPRNQCGVRACSSHYVRGQGNVTIPVIPNHVTKTRPWQCCGGNTCHVMDAETGLSLGNIKAACIL